jgi:hypothetical protein
MDGESNSIMPRPIDYMEGYQAGGFTEALADETSVHHNIDKLLFEANLPKHTMGIHKPFVIGGTDDIVANIAMSPLIAAKKIPSLLKKIKGINLKSPLYHYTSSGGAAKILKEGRIKGASQAFPGKPFKSEPRWMDIEPTQQFAPWYRVPSPAVSVTRDPAFLTRPHKHVKTDISFITDKPSLKRKGYKIQPFAEKGYKKTIYHLPSGGRPNPRFEFEERIRGNLSLEDVKMINVSRLPGRFKDNKNLLTSLEETNIPVIFSKGAKKKLKSFKDDIRKTMKWRGKSGQLYQSQNPFFQRDKKTLNSLLKYTSYKNPLKRPRYNQPTLKQPKELPPKLSSKEHKEFLEKIQAMDKYISGGS